MKIIKINMPEKPLLKLPSLPFIAKLAFALVSLIGLGYLLHLGQTILAPFFLAFLISMLFLPFANMLENKLKFGRGLSSIASVFVMLLILCGLGYFFGSQIADFSEDIPLLEKQFNVVFHQLQGWISSSFHVNAEKQFAYINNGVDRLLSSSGVILSFTLGLFSTGLGFFFFFILFFIFILNYRRVLYQFIINIFSDSHKSKVREVVNEVQQMTKKYIIGLCIQIVIVSALTMLMLSLIGVKYALLLGVLTGLLNVIPYIGVFSSMLVSMLIAFATGAPVTSLYVLIGYIIMHAIDGNIVLPFVVGSKVKINALFSFIGILVGEHLWGISGMFLCIPALAIIKIVFERIESLQPWGQVLGEGTNPDKKGH
ncbi:AI-2E family transporter [Sphingobacterium sp. MYb382]|uniref:AI-2E family transporter n=1 Tax=Sphingobacterium sp. MYb382 TaxID=2745278 RepID=UPI00309DB713